MEKFVDYYNLFGVSRNATKEEIKKAYRKKAKEYHPDSGGSNEKFLLLKKAFDTLNNNFDRINYNNIYDAYKKQEERDETKSFKQNFGSERSTNDDDKAHRENTDKSKQEEETNKRYNKTNYRNKETNLDNTTSFTNHFKIWRGIAVLSVILNFILIMFFLDTYPNEEIVLTNKNVEPLQQEKVNLFSQEEYDELLNDNSILEEQLATISKDYNEQISYIEELEKKISDIAMLPITASVSNSNSIITKEKQNSVSSNKDFFTLGSSQEQVKQIMGTPDSIIGDWWGYEYSNVTFEDGVVSGWSDISKNLKVSIGQKNSEISSFTLGSSFQDVVDIMGTPDSIIGDWWGYEYSNVTFEGGVVSGWSDISNNLKVK